MLVSDIVIWGIYVKMHVRPLVYDVAGVATTERLRKRRCLKYSVVVLVAVSASFLFLQYPASKLQFRSESHHELPIVKARARRQDVAPEILDPVAISPVRISSYEEIYTFIVDPM